MAYTDYNWITDRFAVGALVSDRDDDFPFDAVMSLETHAPATLRELAASEGVDYRWFSIIDGYSWEGNDEIVRRFDTAAAQLNAWLQEDKTVLVHCTAGVSRSVTTVVWYLVRYQGYSWNDAVDLIRSHRTKANPNPRFEIPLRLAAGEAVTREWIEQRLNDFCARMHAEFGVDADPQEIWLDLERQGTLERLQSVAQR